MSTNLVFDLANLEDLSGCTGPPIPLFDEPRFSSTGNVVIVSFISHVGELEGSKDEEVSSTGDVESPALAVGGEEVGTSTEIGIAVSPSRVQEQITMLFRGATQEVFEDGMMTDFIAGVLKAISRYGVCAITAVNEILESDGIEAESKGEVLRWLGDIEQKTTYDYRRWLLEHTLTNATDLAILDGANIGLSHMDDPHSIGFFKEAIENAGIPAIRTILEQTLAQLEETRQCQCCSEG